MVDIDKDKLIQVYGIDDDNFISYLNKFGTLKKIVNMCRLDVIPKEKLYHLYNRFIYFNSLGHNLDTIVEETTPIIRNLFYYNGNGHFEYLLPDNDELMMPNHECMVSISGRVCQVKLAFKNKKVIKENDLLFSLIPAPISRFRVKIFTKSGNITLIIDDNGINYASETDLPIDTFISDTFTYIFRK